jgi:hypothetical protein
MALRTPTVVQENTGTFDVVGASSYSFSLTSDVTPGNAVVLFWGVGTNAANTRTMGNGWHRVTAPGATNFNVSVYVRYNQGDATKTFDGHLTGSAYGCWRILEISDCDRIESLESTNGRSTAPASGGSNSSEWWGGMLIGLFHWNDAAAAGVSQLGTLSAVTSGYAQQGAAVYSSKTTAAVLQNDCYVDLWTQTITDHKADPSIAGTLSSTDNWAAAVLIAVKTGRTYINGAEHNNAPAASSSGTGAYSINAAQKRTGSPGTLGHKVSAAAQNFRVTWGLVNQAKTYYMQCYVRVETAPATTQPIMWLGAASSAPDGVALWYNQSTTKFALRIYSEDVGLAARTQQTTVDSTSTISTATWYRVEWFVHIVGENMTVNWWVDGTAQTDATYDSTAASGGAEWYLPPRVWAMGNLGSGSTATYEYWFDDFVFICDRQYTKNNTEPYGPLGVSGILIDGHGTDVNNGNFQDNGSASWGTPDYTKLTDALPGTADYVKQVTASTTSYAELTLGDPASVSYGAATCYLARTTLTTDMRIVIGGDEYPLGQQANHTASATNPYFSTDAYSSVPAAYTQSDMNAMTLRWGFAHTVSTAPRFNAAVVEVVGLPVVSAGGDVWGWSDSDETWGAMVG